MHKLAVVIAAPLALAACSTLPGAQSDLVGTAALRMADGRPAGTATLVETGNALALDVAVSGLPSGPKGFHLHMTGQCSPPDFQSAGGHLNPFNRAHGLADPDGAHLGDLPNLQVEPNGVARARFDLTGTKSELLPLLFDSDGTAVMIHAQADDNVTDPSGSSGDRIVCGVLERSS